MVLGEGALDAYRKDHFLQFAVKGLLAREQEVLGHLLRDGRRSHLMVAASAAEVRESCPQDALDVEAAMLVEALVFGGQKRIDQALRDGATRHINAPLTRELGDKLAIICMDSRQHGRLVFGEPLVVRQILGDLPKDETHSTRPGEKHDEADRDHETKETSQEAATPPRSFQRLFGSGNVQLDPLSARRGSL